MSITKRDKSGKIKPGGKSLSSDEAKELVSRRWDKERGQAVDALLHEFGYESQDDAPEHLRLLASKAAVSGSGSVTALVQLIKQLGSDRGAEGREIRLKPGQECPTCHTPYRTELTASFLRQVLEMTGGYPLEASIE